MEKKIYQQPTATVVAVQTEGAMLTGSIEATRQSYGTAHEDSWGD